MIGSQYYASSPTLRPDSVYAMVNLDMVGRLRNQTLAVAGLETADSWPSVLDAARPDGMRFSFSDASLERSDQWSFISFLGAPGIHLFTGLHDDYHTPFDDAHLLNYDGLERVTVLALGLMWDLATRLDPM